MRDEYLKYLGWSLNDDNNEVRRAVIGALHRILDCTEHTAKLHTFAARFADPLATLAALDKDAVMNHQVVLLLQKLDKEGLLDTVSEEVLDLVDRIVFDLDIAEETRSEALVFFMNHTEGFEVDEEAEEKVAAVRASDAKKSTKRGKSLARKPLTDAQLHFQRAVNQLETLCEFVELHESEQYRSKTKMLVEACLLVEDSRRLLTVNWSVIISLLLKESDGLVSSTLRPALVSILLSFFVSSADILRMEMNGEIGVTRSEEEMSQQWASLGEVLKTDLHPLLVRFRDDPDNTAMLVHLFENVDSTAAGSSLKNLTQQAVDIFETCQQDDMMRKIVAVLQA